MPYSIIQLPVSPKFHELSKGDLKTYYKWFMEVMPERIDTLSATVRSTPGFESWQSDLTPGSLDRLGRWFETQVDKRARTKEEVAELAVGILSPIDIPNWDLTERTFSLAFDIGMYLGRVFVTQYPSLKWTQPLGSRRFVDFGQPVLMQFTEGPLNPIALVITNAYSTVTKPKTHGSLREIYDIWSKMVIA